MNAFPMYTCRIFCFFNLYVNDFMIVLPNYLKNNRKCFLFSFFYIQALIFFNGNSFNSCSVDWDTPFVLSILVVYLFIWYIYLFTKFICHYLTMEIPPDIHSGPQCMMNLLFQRNDGPFQNTLYISLQFSSKNIPMR